MKRILLVFAVLSVASIGYAQEVFGSDHEAFVLSPAVVISSGPTKIGSFSRSGKVILYKRLEIKKPEDYLYEKSPDEYEWYAYNRLTQTSQRLKIPNKALDPVVMAGDQVVTYLDSEAKKRTFYNIEKQLTTLVAEPEVRPINDGSQFDFLTYSRGNRVRLVFSDGTTLDFDLDSKLELLGPVSEDRESMVFLTTVGRQSDSLLDRTPRDYVRLSVDRKKGTTMSKSLNEDEVQKILSSAMFGADEKFEVDSDQGWLSVSVASDEKTPKKTAVPVSARIGPGPHYDRSFDEMSIVYQQAGSLLLRDIHPISLDLALRVTQTNLQKALMNDAKQMGLASLILAADNDDVLPGAKEWKDKVLPYIKDIDLANRFNYTFKGGSINVEDPAKTELGFIMGPGGRAVVYLDGNTKWIPNP
ncbi:MAG: hypothetical protein GC165_14045 [Armatimonadetes bacterium]|nr:hypothetical protein [Armatimonadota bacterium]